MNVIDLEHGLVGCYGIVGGSIAAALGAGMSAKRQGRVAVCFFGDGATNQGYFHECMNMAAVCQAAGRVRVREQPLRASSRRWPTRPPAPTSPAAPRAYGVPSAVVDGNDLWAVRDAAA